MVDEVLSRFARLDAVVNNAGIAAVGDEHEEQTFLESTEDAWDRDIAINLKTAYNVTRRVLPAKAGLDGLTRALAHDYGRRGVTVNSVAPGWIATGSSSEEAIRGGAATPIG